MRVLFGDRLNMTEQRTDQLVLELIFYLNCAKRSTPKQVYCILLSL